MDNYKILVKNKLTELVKYSLKDKSIWLLLLSNILATWFMINAKQGVTSFLMIFWVQSFIIGLFNVVRILRLKEFSVNGLRTNGQLATNTPATKYDTALFFIAHYNLFLLVALNAILGLPLKEILFEGVLQKQLNLIIIPGSIFFVNHLFSFIYNAPRDTKKQNVGTLMFYPYIRMLPLFLASFFVLSNIVVGVINLLVIKTITDLITHAIEHQIRKGEDH